MTCSNCTGWCSRVRYIGKMYLCDPTNSSADVFNQTIAFRPRLSRVRFFFFVWLRKSVWSCYAIPGVGGKSPRAHTEIPAFSTRARTHRIPRRGIPRFVDVCVCVCFPASRNTQKSTIQIVRNQMHWTLTIWLAAGCGHRRRRPPRVFWPPTGQARTYTLTRCRYYLYIGAIRSRFRHLCMCAI